MDPLECVERCFMAQKAIYLGKCSICIWKEYAGIAAACWECKSAGLVMGRRGPCPSSFSSSALSAVSTELRKSPPTVFSLPLLCPPFPPHRHPPPQYLRLTLTHRTTGLNSSRQESLALRCRDWAPDCKAGRSSTSYLLDLRWTSLSLGAFFIIKSTFFWCYFSHSFWFNLASFDCS